MERLFVAIHHTWVPFVDNYLYVYDGIPYATLQDIYHILSDVVHYMRTVHTHTDDCVYTLNRINLLLQDIVDEIEPALLGYVAYDCFEVVADNLQESLYFFSLL